MDPKHLETDFNLTDDHPAGVPADETHTQSPPLDGGNTTKLRNVGQVEISDEATLEELKTQVQFWTLSESTQSVKSSPKYFDCFCKV